MRTRVKFCGITRLDDALHAARLGADGVGLVFYPPSPRYLAPTDAASIVAALPPFVTCVALFVDAPHTEVARVLQTLRIDLLQFHGAEPPDYCVSFGVPYIKAIQVQAGTDLLQYARHYRSARGLLLDTYRPGIPGGTGQCFDWTLVPRGLPLPIILSGGLSEDNAALAMRVVRPWAVDVSTGVEASKGVKDPIKMARFMQEVCNEDLRLA
jgi:phosphoribosylanthranilate isomerase